MGFNTMEMLFESLRDIELRDRDFEFDDGKNIALFDKDGSFIGYLD